MIYQLMRSRFQALFLCMLTGAISIPAYSAIKTGENITTTVIASNIDSPWGMAWLNDDELLVTEKGVGGWRININTGEKYAISGWPSAINTAGQGGLLDVVADPDFANNQTLYFSYSHRQGSNKTTTRVSSAVLKQNQLTQWKVLFTATPYSGSRQHFGSRLAFKDNHLFITVGDRGDRHRAQDLTDNAGKVHRIHPDGSIPNDNPFKSTTTAEGTPIPETIYSYGHRNPQGLYIDKTGNIWIHEHGPRGGDELNLVEKGKNYGWPVITYGKEYWGPSIGEGTHKKGMQQPYYAYVPSIAPSGLVRYEGALFTDWQDDFLLGALKERHLNRLTSTSTSISTAEKTTFDEYRYLTRQDHRIRDIEVDRQGAIYLLTDDTDGQLIKITP